METFNQSILRKRLIMITFTFFIFYTGSSQVQYSGTIISGNEASAINFETQATGDYSFASGYLSIAEGITSFACGYQNQALGPYSIAIGHLCSSQGQGVAIGQGAKAMSDQSYAFGKYVEAYNTGAMSIGSSSSGYPLINTIAHSLAIGFNSIVPTFFVSEAEFTSGHNGLGKVGIGTSEPVARLQVTDGDIYIEDINSGIVMKSPDGNCWRGTLDNDGQLVFVKLPDCISLSDKTETCPENTSNIKIFPNPTSDFITIQCSENEYEKYNTISLYDANGKTIMTLPLTHSSTKVNVNALNPGQYVLTISGENVSSSEIIIVK